MVGIKVGIECSWSEVIYIESFVGFIYQIYFSSKKLFSDSFTSSLFLFQFFMIKHKRIRCWKGTSIMMIISDGLNQ